MISNITSLPTKGSSTFGDILIKMQETLGDEQKDLKVFSGAVILETDRGVAYFNLTRDTVLHLVGLLEVAKVALVDELGDLDNY